MMMQWPPRLTLHASVAVGTSVTVAVAATVTVTVIATEIVIMIVTKGVSTAADHPEVPPLLFLAPLPLHVAPQISTPTNTGTFALPDFSLNQFRNMQ
jgi:hypothetical protein